MKKIFLFLAITSSLIFVACEGPEGPRGETGYSAEAAVYEIDRVNFTSPSYGIFFTFPSAALSSDHTLVYRLSGVDGGEDVWQLIPQYKYTSSGTLDFGYNYDATRFDVNIYLEGSDLGTITDQYRLDQVFRIVIIPGQFANKGNTNAVDLSDYNAVAKAYHIDKNSIRRIN